ncbi:MAG: hypothetical protein IPK13_01245 [Deltaproteobacteria bacterium]|nr:hypothetical protein [Deltaproteobacteria bacterium]
MDWTTPGHIKAQVQRAWDRGQILSAHFTGEPLFPMRLALRKPKRHALAERFDEVRAWIRLLDEGSRAHRGHGYDIQWTEFTHRQLGRNRVPEGLVIPTQDDALQLIGKRRSMARFDALAALTMRRLPELRERIARKPLQLLDDDNAWPRIIDVVAWMHANPHPGIYVRQLSLPGIDTKFIEAHRTVITALLDALNPAIDAPTANSKRSFEQRFGFRSKPVLARFRCLDPNATLGGLTDITAPIAELAQHPPPGRSVFITENDINGLAFPPVEDALVIFGLGYGVDALAELTWLAARRIVYWGDIDTHGFVMLDRLRAAFPHAESLLMDRATLLAHRDQWVEEDVPHKGPLTRLTGEELTLYEALVADEFGQRVRLEQERIAFDALDLWLRSNAATEPGLDSTMRTR